MTTLLGARSSEGLGLKNKARHGASVKTRWTETGNCGWGRPRDLASTPVAGIQAEARKSCMGGCLNGKLPALPQELPPRIFSGQVHPIMTEITGTCERNRARACKLGRNRI